MARQILAIFFALVGSTAFAQTDKLGEGKDCLRDELTEIILEHKLRSSVSDFNTWPPERQAEVSEVAHSLATSLETAFESGGFANLAVVMSLSLPANTAAHYLGAWKHCHPDRLD